MALQTIVAGDTGAQASAKIIANDTEVQTSPWAAGSYATNKMVTAVLDGNEYVFRSKVNANTVSPAIADLNSSGNWAFVGKTDRRIFATVAAANTAITNTVANGKNQRDGVTVLIGAAQVYASYTWRGGTADANLLAVNTTVTALTSVNLFDLTKVATGFSISNSNPDTETANAGSVYIKGIPVTDKKSVYIQGRDVDTVVVPRDINNVKLPMMYGTTNYSSGAANGVYSLPDGTAFLDIQLQVGTAHPVTLANVQVEYGVEPTAVVPYGTLTKINQIDGKVLAYVDDTDISTIDIASANVFNYKADIVFGSTMGNVTYTGQLDIISKSNTNAHTRLMPIPVGAANLTIQGRQSTARGFAFYDVSKNLMPVTVGTKYWDVVANTTLAIPTGAAYYRFQIVLSDSVNWVTYAKLIMVEFNASASPFVVYSFSKQITAIRSKPIYIPPIPAISSRKFTNNAVSYFGDTLVFISRYSATENIKVTFTRHLLNNSFLLESIRIIAYTGDAITTDDFSKATTKVIVDASTTDVISPYQVNDGFDLTSAPFISGNHGVGSVPTAALISYQVFADGAQLTAGFYYDAREVTIQNKAQVYLYSGQAATTPTNTVVFYEYHNYRILKHGVVSATVGIEMARAIPFMLMYAQQGIQFSSIMTQIYVPKSGVNTIGTFNLATNETYGTYGTTPAVDTCILLDATATDCIAYWLDLGVGLGAAPSLPSGAPGILKSPSNKIYHRVIDPATPKTTAIGDRMYYNCCFIPFKNLLTAPSIAYLYYDKGSTYLVFNFASTGAATNYIVHQDIVGRQFTIVSNDSTVVIADLFATAYGLRIVTTGYGNAVLKLV